MRTTVFEFGLRVTAPDEDECLKALATALTSVKGVDKVDWIFTQCHYVLSVATSFENGQAAMKIHRRINSVFDKSKGIVVGSAHTNLTEVFGDDP
jgi:hypothetical protein